MLRGALPFDQHLLVACVAPRALLVEGFDNAYDWTWMMDFADGVFGRKRD